jgi:hypothetical protein
MRNKENRLTLWLCIQYDPHSYFKRYLLEDAMKASTLKINGSRVIPVDMIRFLKPLSDEDRSKAGDKLEIDASKFKVRIEFADKSSKLATDTLEQIQGQGVALVSVGGDRHVPAINIKAAETWSQEDAAKLRDSGDYTLSQEFRSRVETTAGAILSTSTPEQVMERRSKALGLGGGSSSATTEAPVTAPAKTARAGKGPKAAIG